MLPQITALYNSNNHTRNQKIINPEKDKLVNQNNYRKDIIERKFRGASSSPNNKVPKLSLLNECAPIKNAFTPVNRVIKSIDFNNNNNS